MRTKEVVMEEAKKDPSVSEETDTASGSQTIRYYDAYNYALLEVMLDIRDQLALLNNKIPTLKLGGTPPSAPPPKVA